MLCNVVIIGGQTGFEKWTRARPSSAPVGDVTLNGQLLVPVVAVHRLIFAFNAVWMTTGYPYSMSKGRTRSFQD